MRGGMGHICCALKSCSRIADGLPMKRTHRRFWNPGRCLGAVAAIAAVSLLVIPLSSPAATGAPRHKIGKSSHGAQVQVIPDCPDYNRELNTPDYGYCRLTRIHIDISGALPPILPCPSFTAHAGTCTGYTPEGPTPWGGPKTGGTEVEWRVEGWPDPSFRVLEIHTHAKESRTMMSEIVGGVPGPGSARFDVSVATAFGAQGEPRFDTEGSPDVAPGELGGPLYLNWENGKWGADLYIHGYLRCRC
jgi:hypothetical protein